jgi:hypothetical protein
MFFKGLERVFCLVLFFYLSIVPLLHFAQQKKNVRHENGKKGKGTKTSNKLLKETKKTGRLSTVDTHLLNEYSENSIQWIQIPLIIKSHLLI